VQFLGLSDVVLEQTVDRWCFGRVVSRNFDRAHTVQVADLLSEAALRLIMEVNLETLVAEFQLMLLIIVLLKLLQSLNLLQLLLVINIMVQLSLLELTLLICEFVVHIL
jgi:hypothetical protein